MGAKHNEIRYLEKRINSWNNNGTEEDPYIIANWSIYPLFNPGIAISNVDAYFVIESCKIVGCRLLASFGINPLGSMVFNNLENGKIIDFCCYNLKNSYGVVFVSSSCNIKKQ